MGEFQSKACSLGECLFLNAGDHQGKACVQDAGRQTVELRRVLSHPLLPSAGGQHRAVAALPLQLLSDQSALSHCAANPCYRSDNMTNFKTTRLSHT